MAKNMAELSERDLLGQISQKLDRVIAILAAQGKDKETQARILSKLGMKSPEIAALLDRTPVWVRKARTKRRTTKRKRSRGGATG